MVNNQSGKPDDLELLKKLDLIAEAFEAECNNDGERPAIEEFVRLHDEIPAERLLRELVALEVELRLKAGEAPRAEEYAERFNELDRDWLAKVISDKTALTASLNQDSDPDATFVRKESPAGANDADTSTLAPTSPKKKPSTTKFSSFGDYEIIDEIARGGMGVVYKARQKSLNRVVALKMILSGQLAGEEEIQRFRSEAEAAANLDHPGIVPVYEIGEHDDHQFFSMGFVEGSSLQHKIIDGPLPAKEAAELTKKVAEAISYAHGKGVIHRDLKPANVLLDQNGEPKVTDFGLAKRIDSDSDLTRTTQAMGSPSWMPPEQASGKSSTVDQRADVYALGAVLYNLITGRPPFQAATHLDTMMQVIEKEPVRPRTLDPKIPVDLETITLKCLEKDPNNRYQSSEEFSDELQRFTNGEPIQARPIGQTARLWRWCKRKPMAATALSAASLLLLLLLVGLPVLWAQQKQIATAATKLADEKTKGEKAARQNAEVLEKTLVRSNFFASKFHWLEGDSSDAISILKQVSRNYRNFNWNFLMRSYVGSVSLPGFDAVLSFDPACPRALSISGNSLRLWDWTTGKTIQELEGVEGKPQSAVFSRDGKYLGVHVVDLEQLEIIEGSSDLFPQNVPVLQVFDGVTGELIHTELGWASRNVGLYAGPDKSQLSTISNKQLLVFDSSDSKFSPHFKGKQFTGIIAFNPNGGKLATFNEKNKKIEISETRTGEIVAELPKNGQVSLSFLGALKFSPDETKLFVGSPTEIWMFDLLSGEVKHNESWRVGQCEFSPDGSKIAIALAGRSVIEIRESETLKLLETFQGPTAFGKLCFGAHGAFVHTISNGLLNSWDLRKENNARAFTNHLESVQALDIHPDGMLVASSDGKAAVSSAAKIPGTIKIWNPATFETIRQVNGHTGEVSCLSFHSDGSVLASGSWDNSVILWDTSTWSPVRTFVGHDSAVQSVAFSPDGKLLATGCWKGGIIVWRTNTGEKVLELNGHEKNVATVSFSNDGSKLVSGSWDGSVLCWDTTSGERLQEIKVPMASRVSGISSISLDSSGRHVACGITHDALGFPTPIPIFNLESGKLVQTLEGHSQGVPAVCFDSTGSVLASGSDDGTVVLWDMETGEERHTLKAGSFVTQVKISKCGQFLAAASFDKKVQIWDARDVWELDWEIEKPNVGSAKAYDLSLRKSITYVDPTWHENQALKYFENQNRFAETFHRGWLKKSDLERARLHDELLVAQEARLTAYKKSGSMGPMIVPQIVSDMLNIERGTKFSDDDAEKVNGVIWQNISVPGSSATVREIEDMKNICQQHPHGYFFNTLAVCYLRNKQFEQAIEAANISASKMPKELELPSVHPIDLAVLAISNHKLGNVGAAKDYQRKFNQAMQSDEFSKDEECESFRKEVNSAFESQR